MIRLFSALVACLVLAASPTSAATFTATNPDTLWSALKSAAAGDVVLLADGVYPAASFNSSDAYPYFVKSGVGVTIQPAPGAHPVLGGLAMNGAKGLHFIGLEVSITDPAVAYGVQVNGGAGLTFDQMKVHGSASGVGFFIRDSTDIAITNSDVYKLGVGASLIDDTRPVVRANRFHDLETDGIDNAGDLSPIIDGNSFTDFYPVVGDHPDAIQFWGTVLHPVGQNALVINNLITRGLGHAVNTDGTTVLGPFGPQGIFAENQAGMTVRGNVVNCTLYNGISVSAVATALIEQNFVRGCTDMGTQIIARDGSSDVTVKDNQVTQKVVDLVQSNSAPNVRFVETGSIPIPTATSPTDTAAMDAWLKARGDPTPPPVDPRDAQIIALTAQVANLNATVATLTQAASDNAAQLAAANAQVATLTQAANDNAATITGLQAQLATATSAGAASAAQVTTLTAQLASVTAADKAQITALNSQVAGLTAQLSNAKAQIAALLASETGRKKALSGIAATATAAAK